MLRKRATLIVKMKEGILVAKHIFNFRYGLLGGGVKYRESFEEAGKRELFEEIGIKAERLEYLFELKYRLQEHKVFFVEIKNKRGLIKHWEINEHRFINRNNFREFKSNKYTERILDRYFARFL